MNNTVPIDKNKKKILTLKIMYILSLLGMLSLVCAIHITREKPEEKGDQQTYNNISELWCVDNKETKKADLKKLGEHIDEETGKLSLYYTLPELTEDVDLVYRSKDVYTRVLVDGEEIYATYVYDSPYYNESPGNLWNMLKVGKVYSQKQLEIEITMVYDTSSITVDSLYLGDKADIIVAVCADNVIGIVISSLLMLLGVVLVVIDYLPAYGHAKKHHGLWWVGLYALLTGLWGVLETNTMQFFVPDMRIIQVIDNMLMLFSTVPLVIYINNELGILQNRIVRMLSYSCVLYGVLAVVFQYTGFTDMHAMLAPSSIFSVSTDIAMSVWLVVKCIKTKKAKKPIINSLLITIGVILRSLCSVVETVRSLRVDRLDRAGLIRVGMLLLCICFAIGSQINTYKIVAQGMKYELVSKLAYSDGLTGLGNRTAYLEKLDEYKNNSSHLKHLGIVYLDVNDLKKVNDNLGHDYGDRLIKSAAGIIDESFGIFGKSYRIGGDEFCVLMSGDNIEEDYKNALDIFKDRINEKNNSKIYDYTINIAHGFSNCDDISADGIEEAIAKADSEMYKDKARLKGI